MHLLMRVAVRLKADAGPGIPAEECARVFERFCRGRAGGIAREALQRLQGRLM